MVSHTRPGGVARPLLRTRASGLGFYLLQNRHRNGWRFSLNREGVVIGDMMVRALILVDDLPLTIRGGAKERTTGTAAQPQLMVTFPICSCSPFFLSITATYEVDGLYRDNGWRAKLTLAATPDRGLPDSLRIGSKWMCVRVLAMVWMLPYLYFH